MGRIGVFLMTLLDRKKRQTWLSLTPPSTRTIGDGSYERKIRADVFFLSTSGQPL